MKFKAPRYLVGKRSGAGVRWYWQPPRRLVDAGWRTERLPDERIEAARRAETLNAQLDRWYRAGRPPLETAATPEARRPAAGTVAALIAEYRASRLWRALKPKTQKDYDYVFRQLERRLGDIAAAAVDVRLVEKILDTVEARHPVKAAHLCRVARLLWSYGESLELVHRNPWRNQRIGGAGARGRPWSDAAIDAVIAAAEAAGRPSLACMVAVNAWAGQRPSDLLTVPATAWDGTALRLRQHKTGMPVSLALASVPAVAARLEAERRRRAEARIAATTLFVNDTTGQPWTESAFNHVFARIRAAAAAAAPDTAPDIAGTPDDPRPLRFHWLRHTAVTRMYDAGAALQDIIDVTGHSEAGAARIIGRYRERTGARSAAAFIVRLQAEQ